MPTALFEQTNELARRMHKSRSQVVAEALREYVARHDPDAVTQRLNALIDEHGQQDAELATAASRRILEQNDW